MAAKICYDDDVVILTGKYKGKHGRVKRVLSTRKIIVEGVNIVKKHQKSRPSSHQPGGIIEKEAAIDISNVAIINPVTGTADRVRFKMEKGKKVRIFQSNGERIN